MIHVYPDSILCCCAAASTSRTITFQHLHPDFTPLERTKKAITPRLSLGTSSTSKCFHGCTVSREITQAFLPCTLDEHPTHHMLRLARFKASSCSGVCWPLGFDLSTGFDSS